MKNVLIFDGSYFLSRFSKSKYKLYNSDGINIYPLYYTIKLIADNIIRYKPKEVYFVIDIGRDIKKKQKLEEYKKKRILKKEKLYDSAFTDDEYEDYALARSVITNYLSQTLPINVLTIPLVEGDTILYYIANKKTEENYHSIIFTGDKDILQVIDKNISVSLSNREKGYEFLTIDRFDYIYSKLDFYVNSSKFFHPRNLPYYRALTGDVSDNIAGIKGIGTKTVSKLIKLAQENNIEIFNSPVEFIEFYENQYNNLTNRHKSLKNIIRKFLDNIEKWLNIFEVIDLRYSVHEELSGIKVSQIERELNKEVKFDIKRTIEIFKEYDLDSDFRYYEWLTIFNSLYTKDYSLLNERIRIEDITTLLTEIENKIQRYIKLEIKNQI